MEVPGKHVACPGVEIVRKEGLGMLDASMLSLGHIDPLSAILPVISVLRLSVKASPQGVGFESAPVRLCRAQYPLHP